MKHTIEIVPATSLHVQELGRSMNEEDRYEVEYLGLKSHRALWRGWKNSIVRKTALVDGVVGAIWGLQTDFMGLTGVAWLLTGKKAREVNPIEFARIYRSEARKMLEICPMIYNYVDDEYLGAKRMLRLAGFTLEDATPVGKLKRLYRRFYMEA